MRVTLLAVGSRGDVQPMIALGRGLTASGHEVLLATHPRFRQAVVDQGLDFAPLAEGDLSRGVETAAGRRWIQTGSKRMPTWVGFLRDARSVASRRLIDTAAACYGAEAIIASNLAMLLGWQMATHRDVPLVRAFIEPPAWMLTKRSTQRVAPVIRQLAWLGARPWLNRVRRGALGLPPVPLREPFLDLDRSGAPTLYAFSAAVLPASSRVGQPGQVTGYWFLEETIDPEPPAALREFLAAGPPPVSIGFSTMIDEDPPARARLAVEALRLAGVRGLLQGSADDLRDVPLPPDVFTAADISHRWLFPQCAAVVHHAAVGTAAAALRAGVPAVTIPHMTDQFLWARRLQDLGVSPAPVPRRELTAQRLAEAIRQATTDAQMRSRAAAVKAQIDAESGVARAVELFERTVARTDSASFIHPRSPVRA